MSVWSVLKRRLGATDEAPRPGHPTFEHLEPRLLLSAGLAGPNLLDLPDDQSGPDAHIQDEII